MFFNKFEGLKLEFQGIFYGGSYEIEVFPDGRLYYSFIENDDDFVKNGSFQINQKEVLIFEQLIEYYEYLKEQRRYIVTEINYHKNKILVMKSGRELSLYEGKEMIFEYTKLILDKYSNRGRRIFLIDTYLDRSKYIRDYEKKSRNLNFLDLYREYNSISINTVAVFNQAKQKIGYIPKGKDEIIARLIDSGKKVYALGIPGEDEVILKVYMLD